jgi:aquaporin Z
MVYTIGPISGCHVNPAVTLGVLLAKKINLRDAGMSMVAQVIGAVIASGVILLIANGAPGGYSAPLSGLGADGYGLHSPDHYSLAAGLAAEIVLTMFLVLTVLGSTDISAPVGFAGLAIGPVLTLIHLVGIPITNTSVNPARSIGPAIFVGGWALQQLWMFIVAPFVGAVIAAVIYSAMRHPAILITTRKAEEALPGEQIDRIA